MCNVSLIAAWVRAVWEAEKLHHSQQRWKAAAADQLLRDLLFLPVPILENEVRVGDALCG